MVGKRKPREARKEGLLLVVFFVMNLILNQSKVATNDIVLMGKVPYLSLLFH